MEVEGGACWFAEVVFVGWDISEWRCCSKACCCVSDCLIKGSRSCSDSESVEEVLGLSWEKEDCWEGFRSIRIVGCCRCCLEMEMGCFDICWCKGTTLGLSLVTWVGSHLRAVVSPIAIPLSALLLFCVILCEPVNLILDSVGIYVRYHENGA